MEKMSTRGFPSPAVKVASLLCFLLSFAVSYGGIDSAERDESSGEIPLVGAWGYEPRSFRSRWYYYDGTKWVLSLRSKLHSDKDTAVHHTPFTTAALSYLVLHALNNAYHAWLRGTVSGC